MATDPPVSGRLPGRRAPGQRGQRGRRQPRQALGHLHRPRALGRLLRRLPAGRPRARPRRPDAAIYQCFGIMRTEVIWQAWREVGLLPHQVLIWKKSRAVLTYSSLHVGLRADHVRLARGPHADPQAAGRRHAPSGRSTAASRTAPAGIHPTMKPVETIRRPIGYHTKPGGLIYEPFSGSRHGADRRRDDRAALLRDGALAGLRRRRRGSAGSDFTGKTASKAKDDG